MGMTKGDVMGMGVSKEASVSRQMGLSNAQAGHLYLQTNETRNFIVHYRRSANGEISEVERTATGGAGSGVFKPISGQESAPNAFEGAGSVILSRIESFCLRRTAATTPSPASPWAKMDG